MSEDRSIKYTKSKLNSAFGSKYAVLTLSKFLSHQGKGSFFDKTSDPKEYKTFLDSTLVVVNNEIFDSLFDNCRNKIYSDIVSGGNSAHPWMIELLTNIIIYLLKSNIYSPLTSGMELVSESDDNDYQLKPCFPGSGNSSIANIIDINKQWWDLLISRIGRHHMCQILLDTNVFVHLSGHQQEGYIQICGSGVNFEVPLEDDKLSKHSNKLRDKKRTATKRQNIKPQNEISHFDTVKVLLSKDISKKYAFNSLSSSSVERYHKKRANICLRHNVDKLHSLYFSNKGDVSKGRNGPKLPYQLVSLHQTIERKLEKYPFNLILEEYCPIITHKTGQKKKKDALSNPIHKDGLTMGCVIQFCQTVVRGIIPFEVFGSENNWNQVMSSIARFIRLRKSEKMPMRYVFENVKITEISWLGRIDKKLGRPDLIKRQRILLSVLTWLFSNFLITVIRAYFTVLEATAPNSVLFYRHEVWEAACKQEIESFKQNLQHVKAHRFEQTQNYIRPEKRFPTTPLGVSRLKVVPKFESDSYRIISRLGASSYDFPGQRLKKNKNDFTQGKYLEKLPSVNDRLAKAFQTLNCEVSVYDYIKNRGPGVLTSPFDFPKKIIDYKKRLRNTGQFYAVKLDISKAFDNIPTDLALKLVETLLSSDKYFFKDYTRFSLKLLRAHKQATQAIAEDNPIPLCELLPSKLGEILVENEYVGEETRESILFILKEHLSNNLSIIDGKYYRQAVGIPQGSKLSSMLCDIVYDDFELESLSYDCRNSILFRYVDDFLFVSSNKTEAENFLYSMLTGFQKHGVHINPSKSYINFTPERMNNETFITVKHVDFVGKKINLDTLDFCQKPSETASQHALLCKMGVWSDSSRLEKHIIRLSTYNIAKKYIDLRLHSRAKLVQSIDSTCRFLVRYLDFLMKKSFRRSFNPSRLVDLMNTIAIRMSRIIKDKNGAILYHLGFSPHQVCALKILKYLKRRKKLQPVAISFEKDFVFPKQQKNKEKRKINTD